MKPFPVKLCALLIWTATTLSVSAQNLYTLDVRLIQVGNASSTFNQSLTQTIFDQAKVTLNFSSVHVWNDANIKLTDYNVFGGVISANSLDYTHFQSFTPEQSFPGTGAGELDMKFGTNLTLAGGINNGKTINVFFTTTLSPNLNGRSNQTVPAVWVDSSRGNNTVAHEIGHLLLGDAGHVTDSSNLMHTSSTTATGLTSSQITTIQGSSYLSAVPEPEHYGMVFGVLLMGFAVFRRHKRFNRSAA